MAGTQRMKLAEALKKIPMLAVMLKKDAGRNAKR